MKNLDFIIQVLMSTAEYWIVARECTKREYFETVRDRDEIVFIAIPQNIKRGLTYEEITLKDCETLNNCYADQNIFINANYPPFQCYIGFSSFYKGYPVECDIKQFMIDALALKSDELYIYKSLIKEKEVSNQ